MAISTIDTHKFVRRLEKAGMSLDLAEVQAEVLNEAFTVNLESLVTKDYFESRSDTRFAEQKSYMDTRFAEQKSYMDTRFAEQKSYMDTRFAEQNASIDTRFAELSARVDGNFRVQNWILAIIVAAVLLPYLERILAL
ncbi:unnamed protein product [Discosporangium mesarthrocarpum]